MRLELTGRHIDITPAARTLVQRRIAPVLRKLNDSAVSVHVVLARQKTRVHAEITLHARGVHFLHGAAVGRDTAAAVGAAADKIESQADTLKGKWRERSTRGERTAIKAAVAPSLPPGRPAAARVPRIIRTRRYAVKPMSVEDAAAIIGDGDDSVVVFRNSTTDGVTILFRRPDGNLGLIEPEA